MIFRIPQHIKGVLWILVTLTFSSEKKIARVAIISDDEMQKSITVYCILQQKNTSSLGLGMLLEVWPLLLQVLVVRFTRHHLEKTQ